MRALAAAPVRARPAAAPPTRIAPRIQPQLTIGPVDDPLEREADRIADAVMAGGDAPPVSDDDEPALRRACCDNCTGCAADEEPIRMKAAAAGPQGGSAAAAAAAVARGGTPLPAPVRAYFEPRFARDLGHVRVHTGPAAAGAAHAIGARAYTLGNNIGFASDQWAPDTASGRRLLAHELAHVGQQAAASPAIRRQSARQTLTKERISAILRSSKDLQDFKLKLGLGPISDEHLGRIMLEHGFGATELSGVSVGPAEEYSGPAVSKTPRSQWVERRRIYLADGSSAERSGTRQQLDDMQAEESFAAAVAMVGGLAGAMAGVSAARATNRDIGASSVAVSQRTVEERRMDSTVRPQSPTSLPRRPASQPAPAPAAAPRSAPPAELSGQRAPTSPGTTLNESRNAYRVAGRSYPKDQHVDEFSGRSYDLSASAAPDKPRAQRTAIDAELAEWYDYKTLIAAGEKGLAAPNGSNRRGPDSVTYNPRDGYIYVNDSQTYWSNTAPATSKSTAIKDQWRIEAKQAAQQAAFDDPHLEQQIREAAAQDRIRRRNHVPRRVDPPASSGGPYVDIGEDL